MPTYAGPAGWQKTAPNEISPRPPSLQAALQAALSLDDDDKLFFGTDDDMSIRFDPSEGANGAWIIRDESNNQDRFSVRVGDVLQFIGENVDLNGQDLVDDGTTVYDSNTGTVDVSITDSLSNAISSGEVLADDGSVYSTIQAAENAASDWIFIGKGTFNETVTVDTAGMTIVGTGRGTIVDGQTNGDAFSVTAQNVTIRELAVRTTAGGAQTNNGIDVTANQARIIDVVVLDSDNTGISISASSCVVRDCHVIAADGDGILAANAENRVHVIDCDIDTGVGVDAIDHSADDSIVKGNDISGPGSNGITADANDQLFVANRIDAAGANGIIITGTDQIVSSNRVSGSSTTDIDDTGATTPVVTDNITGAAN